MGRFLTVLFFLVIMVSAQAWVEFPGANPGPAKASLKKDLLTLGNKVLSMSWRIGSSAIEPESLTNRLTGERFTQENTGLVRLLTSPPIPAPQQTFERLSLRLSKNKIDVLAGKPSEILTPILSLPRSTFPGNPSLLRLGKMNLKAQFVDHTDPGEIGACTASNLEIKANGKTVSLEKGWLIEGSNLRDSKVTFTQGQLRISAPAHSGVGYSCKAPVNLSEFSCSIDQGTDQGMSWGPAIALVWPNGKFVLVGVRDRLGPVLNVTTDEGERILTPQADAYPRFDGSLGKGFQVVGSVRVLPVLADSKGVRLADCIEGQALEADLVQPGTSLRVRWRAELRNGSNYIRQTFTLTSDKSTPLYGIQPVDVRIPDAETVGTCAGSPVVGHGFFFGLEMPGARNLVESDRLRIGVACKLVVDKLQPYSFTSVTGVYPKGQLRRGFLYYIERERARPSSPFLHYNCWYDLGFSVDEKSMMDVVQQFDQELVKKRGVALKSYLVDDGWDSPDKGLWTENREKFPNGFEGLKAKMGAFGAHLGIWISPLGGYGGAEERTERAREMGLIPKTSVLDFAEQAYKKWFQDRCLQLMKRGGVNSFKWDRAGEGVSPHFMALLDIAHNLRKANPEVFINVTVGTWPSPFWLLHVDSTWRMNSADVGWAGVGDDREKWVTFRDGYCHRLFVEQGPLYPLNSVMHHGVVHGRCFQGERVGLAGPNLKNEVRSYFGTGAMLQELYLTPSMMTPQAWDWVAESAKWGKKWAEVLVDSHWVGGDPLKLEPYGYAAWSVKGATLTLRNPSDKASTILLDAQTVFELPARTSRTVKLKGSYGDQRVKTLALTAGKPVELRLEPFEVLVFEMEGK